MSLDRFAKEPREPRKEEPKPKKYDSLIIHQITHFFGQGDNKERNTLQVESTPPSLNDQGFPKEGTIGIRLMKEAGSSAMKLNAAEALLLAKTIQDEVAGHLEAIKQLWVR